MENDIYQGGSLEVTTNYLHMNLPLSCELSKMRMYKPITVQHHIADSVSWVPMVTLLNL